MTALLSARLEAVLACAGRCGLLIDLCADHGRVACEAVGRGLARTAVAVELRQAPLGKARRLIGGLGLQRTVFGVRGDGLGSIRRADVIVVAGVGGDLAAQLLGASAGCAGATRVVVQPNRHSREVRGWAAAAGFHLRSERAVADGRSLHLVLGFERAAGADPAYGALPIEVELELGPRLLTSAEPADRSFLRAELHRLRRLSPHHPEWLPAVRALEARFESD